MAGNVKEWCFNATGDDRLTLGGAWDEPVYLYQSPDAREPLTRSDRLGFRTARYERPPERELEAPHERVWRAYTKETPIDDGGFALVRSMYAYDRTPLDPEVHALPESSPHWTVERASFAAAYGGERVFAYLYKPKGFARPHQTVVYFPGSGAEVLPSHDVDLLYLDFVIRSGRALPSPSAGGPSAGRVAPPP